MQSCLHEQQGWLPLLAPEVVAFLTFDELLDAPAHEPTKMPAEATTSGRPGVDMREKMLFC